MKENPNPLWLEWAKELQFIAQAGLTYSKDPFDLERFERIREISAEIMSHQSDLPLEKVKGLFCNETGFQTPKLDTRAAIFKDDKILLVKEKAGVWSLPGGWVDVNQTIKTNTEKEVKEEAGLDVKAVRLIAVQDRNLHNVPPYAYNVCKAFVLCEVTGGSFQSNIETTESRYFSLDEIPEYRGEPYVEINGNRPDFSQEDRNTEAFEAYSSLDSLGRCGTAFANVGQELMPRGERENISQIHPTGWQHVEYDFVDGESLYNRCHLIAHQLTGENANERNLITGTRYMNTEGMLPFEEMVGDYVREEDGHVLYRVTPVFEGSDLVARGVEMEGYSVEDQGESVSFHIFAYNVQPGVEIDYATGDNWLAG